MTGPALLLLVLLTRACDGFLIAAHRTSPHARHAASVLAVSNGVPTNLQALNDNVVVEITNVPEETVAGILLPTVFETDSDFDVSRAPEVRKGKVVSVGPGITNDDGKLCAIDYITPGDTVIVGPFGGIKLQEMGKSAADSSLYMFRAADIWSKVTC